MPANQRRNQYTLKSGTIELILAIILSVRCQAQEATIQLLRKLYDLIDENQAKHLMTRLASCLTVSEKEWLAQLL
jgi:hypothetical protein